MKKLILALVAVFALSLPSFAEDNDYVLNDNAIENAFAQAQEVSLSEINLFTTNSIDLMGAASSASMAAKTDVKPWGAFALSFFLGGFGIHRHYMGTSKWMWAYYTCTCGGIFGIIPFVDCIVLLVGAIENDISSYTNNSDFFMWL